MVSRETHTVLESSVVDGHLPVSTSGDVNAASSSNLLYQVAI